MSATGPAQLARCDQCRTFFDPVYGGVCARCGRLLCATHLHGGFLARIESGTLHAFRNSGAGRVEVVSMSNGRFDHAETEYATLLTEARA